MFGEASQPSLPFGLPSILTLITYAFVHGSNAHLIGNMVVLFVFGGAIEDRLGHGWFVGLWVAAGTIGALGEATVNTGGAAHVVVGASGAIAGVLGAYILFFPRANNRNVAAYFCLCRRPRVARYRRLVCLRCDHAVWW